MTCFIKQNFIKDVMTKNFKTLKRTKFSEK